MTDTDLSNPPLIGLAQLMRRAYNGEDLAPLGTTLIQRAETQADANTLMDLSTLLQLRGNRDLALQVQLDALALQQLYHPPTTGNADSLKLCALMVAGDLMANSPLEFLLEQAEITLILAYPNAHQPLLSQLPAHDLLFVAVAQSDDNMPLLNYLADELNTWHKPVLNRPERIALLSRDQSCRLFTALPGIVMPVTARLTRQQLMPVSQAIIPLDKLLADTDYPIIIRPVDSHAGHGLEKIHTVHELDDYLQIHHEAEFYVSPFVDYRGADGLFRKYRIVLIAGRPFLCHLGISEHWMIHYLNAGMEQSSEKRAEEAFAMTAFDSEFAQKHQLALRGIDETMGLDYVGIDCGETPEGELLIFEVDSCMIVHALDSMALFPYKQPQMHKIFTAFQQLLMHTAHREAH